MKRAFVKTAAQQRAIRLLSGPSRFVMLYGGSRSGKTFILVYAILVRALRAAGSRHAILRLHANTVRQSIRFDTLPKVVKLAFPGLGLSESKVDQLIRLPNGSELWFGGLDTEGGRTRFSARSSRRSISTSAPNSGSRRSAPR